MGKLGLYIEEVNEKTTQNNQYEVLTSSQGGIVSQEDYFNKQVASTDNIGYKIIRKGQFTYRSMSDTGKFYINRLTNKEVGIVSPAYPVFKIASDKIMPEYLSLFFQSEYFQGQISNKASGSTRLALRYSKLENVEIDITAKEKQEEIVKNIDSIKKAIEVEEKEQSILDELIKSRFNELFRPIQYMYDSYYSIGDVCEVNPKKDSLDDNIEITFIPMEKVGVDGSLKLDSLRKYGDIKKGFSQIKENDVLFAKITPCMENGKATIAKGLINGYAGGTTELFVIRCGDKVLPEYLFHIVHSQYFRDKAKPNMRGTVGQQRVGKDFIESFHIDVPDLKRQKEFSVFVKQVDKLKF